MKFITVSRTSKFEKYYHKKMGMLNARVVYIKKKFLNIPFKTIHKYRETYYGEVKPSEECILSR